MEPSSDIVSSDIVSTGEGEVVVVVDEEEEVEVERTPSGLDHQTPKNTFIPLKAKRSSSKKDTGETLEKINKTIELLTQTIHVDIPQGRCREAG